MDDQKQSTNDSPEQGSGKEPVKVILADDDADDQEIFKVAVSETDIPAEVTTVDNGKELMKHLKDESIPNPDVIFLDINMPGKTGKQCLEEIKNDENLKDIPTVMYSTSSNPNEVDESYKAGAELYVVKPSSFTKLVLIVGKILSLSWVGALVRPIRDKFFVSEKQIPDSLNK